MRYSVPFQAIKLKLGKCFELARTGRELIMLVRDESTDDVERLLNQLMKEQKSFEERAEEIKTRLEISYQTQESLKVSLL